MAEIESRDDGITAALKHSEAAALADVAEIGLDVDDALARIRRTATAERALRELRASRGSLSLRRPEAAALAAIAETAFALAESPRGRFRASFEEVDLAAARRGLDSLRGAMRRAAVSVSLMQSKTVEDLKKRIKSIATTGVGFGADGD
jgi:hypothetical protein